MEIGQFRWRRGTAADIQPALNFMASDPIVNVVFMAHLEQVGRFTTSQNPFYVVTDTSRAGSGPERIAAVVWLGGNYLVAFPPAPAAGLIAFLASIIGTQMKAPAALVGRAQPTLQLWHQIGVKWGRPRLVRPSQSALVSTTLQAPPETPIVTLPLRLAELGDLESVLPAAAHMFHSEVGFNPLQTNAAQYRERIQRQILQRETYVKYLVGAVPQLVFKADIGGVSSRFLQVQGVWVHPEYRGAGLGSAAMAELLLLLQRHHSVPSSLYVNDFNVPAVRTYLRVGMCPAATVATVMF